KLVRSPLRWNAPFAGTKLTATSPRAGRNVSCGPPHRIVLAEILGESYRCMRVLVTFAVDAEFAPWRKLRNLRQTKVGDIVVNQAQIGRALVDFVVTGMGAENAARVANAFMIEPYTICIAAGFAGALKPDYSVGMVLVAEGVQHLGSSKTLMGSRNLAHAARDDGA